MRSTGPRVVALRITPIAPRLADQHQIGRQRSARSPWRSPRHGCCPGSHAPRRCVASRRASPRASTLLDLQSGAPGQASIRSSGIVLVDDQADRAPLQHRARSRVAYAEIDRAPRRQAQIRSAGVCRQRHELAKLAGFEPAERRRDADRAAEQAEPRPPAAADRSSATAAARQRPAHRRTPRSTGRACGRAWRQPGRHAPPRWRAVGRRAGGSVPSHCVPSACPGRTRSRRRRQRAQMSARSAAIETAPPPSTSRPNLRRQRVQSRVGVKRSSIARAMGRTSNGWRDRARPAAPTMTLRTASVSASGSSRPSSAELALQLGQALLAQAAELQVGAARQIDVAVAQPLGEIGQCRAPARG